MDFGSCHADFCSTNGSFDERPFVGRVFILSPSVGIASVVARLFLTRASCITSNTRTPTSLGFGASHGAARSVVEASEIPCSQRAFIVPRLNS